MRFIYQYRTSDNVLHEDVVDAATRDDAYALLKARGIRPGRVVEAPGFFNKFFGKGKRWLAIGCLSVIAVGAIVFASRRGDVSSSGLPVRSVGAMARHYIYGDAALMGKLDAEGYASVFSDEGDRFLARFAQPAVDAGTVSYASLPKFSIDSPATFEVLPSDSREVQELKRIVLWMRDEMRVYLSEGTGTPTTYVKRLEERQAREKSIRTLAKVELSNEEDPAKWDERNANLRKLGIETIPMPEH